MSRALTLGLVVVPVVAGALGYSSGAFHPFAPGPASAANECAGFVDVTTSAPACVAIATLVANGIISGYATSPPRFGPLDPVQRAQIAAFPIRALAWQGEATGPRSFTDFGSLVAELRTASLILANKCDNTGLCTARGYEPSGCAARGLAFPCFGPNDSVTHAQVISFIARAFQFDPGFAWAPQSNGALPYQGVPSVHQVDVRTYHAYAGAIPAAPTTEADWSKPAPRAWVARVLFQALDLPPVAVPSPSPSSFPSPSPSASPSPSNCHSSYPGRCIAPSPPDLDCGDIPDRNFPVVGSDPHNFDTDNDGIGCES